MADNLSRYLYLETIPANTEIELKNKLDKIRLPYKIITIYHDGTKHIAILNATHMASIAIKKLKLGEL